MHLNATQTTQLNSKESYLLDSILFSGKLENLYLGSDSSDCPLPCTTFSTEVKISSEVDEYLGFGLNFLSTVQVTNALILFLELPCPSLCPFMTFFYPISRLFTSIQLFTWIICTRSPDKIKRPEGHPAWSGGPQLRPLVFEFPIMLSPRRDNFWMFNCFYIILIWRWPKQSWWHLIWAVSCQRSDVLSCFWSHCEVTMT